LLENVGSFTTTGSLENSSIRDAPIGVGNWFKGYLDAELL